MTANARPRKPGKRQRDFLAEIADAVGGRTPLHMGTRGRTWAMPGDDMVPVEMIEACGRWNWIDFHEDHTGRVVDRYLTLTDIGREALNDR